MLYIIAISGLFYKKSTDIYKRGTDIYKYTVDISVKTHYNTIYMVIYKISGGFMRIISSSTLETTRLNGYIHYNIPGVVVSEKGNIFVYYEARQGGDWSVIDIKMKKSSDCGHTWSESRVLYGGKGKNTVNNPVMVADGDRLHFICMENYHRAFCMHSFDEGETWTEPAEITCAFDEAFERCPWTCIAAGPGHGIRMATGRLLVPVWLAYNPTCTHAHSPSVTSTMFSDDRGETWHIGDIISEFYLKNPNEACVAELSDGEILINMRNDNDIKYRCTAVCFDGKWRWRDVFFDKNLPDPTCAGGMCSSGDVLLFTNCVSQNSRVNLTLRKSADGGKTWTENLMYEPIGGYSDVYIDPVSKNAVLACESGDSEIKAFVAEI